MTICYNEINKLMSPAAWPMDPGMIEARRREAERLLGRPYPAVPREDICKTGVVHLMAAIEWKALDNMRNGVAPHIMKLP